MKEKTFKVTDILPMQQGTSEHGDWKNQEIIVEAQQNVQYPDRYLLTFKGSNVDKLKDIKVGDVVNAEWSSLVRAYEKKDGTKGCSQQNVCWKIERPSPALP